MPNDREQRWAMLMGKAQDGDPEAYRCLLDEISVAIEKFVKQRLLSLSAVHDVVQETLLSIHRSRHTFDISRPFGPWMYAIARNRLNDFLRKSIRVAKREITNDDKVNSFAESKDPVETAMIDEVKLALEDLPEKQRTIIEMLKLRSMSVAEVAEKLQMSPSAVKVNAHRGYVALRKRFGVIRGD